MSTMGWIWIMIAFLVVELIFIYIVIHKAYRFKHTIDPIDARGKEMKETGSDNHHTEFTK
ncbi:YtzI protein [Sporosarcina sp. ACRSM]|uniref:YtzI protein n=1 Tax=Sporosarcina sp. ACRSM TaxID=2918216 RepID=UPI001EF69765|nr:YtzI protein [Sporosarcina sp. ACRSM]MCG7333832.1 YtzI protein [Sporosarcina sp. ACRSM]